MCLKPKIKKMGGFVSFITGGWAAATRTSTAAERPRRSQTARYPTAAGTGYIVATTGLPPTRLSQAVPYLGMQRMGCIVTTPHLYLAAVPFQAIHKMAYMEMMALTPRQRSRGAH